MRLNGPARIVVISMFAGVVSACGQQRGLSPLSPTELSSRNTGDAPRAREATLAPRRVDNDGDGYEDPYDYPMPDPGAGPGPNPMPGPPPPTDGVPVPVPVQLTISIVGSFGNLAFAPNPQQAAIGNMVVWMNNDFVQHTIVLDDGTPVGTLAPGQSSTPIALVTDTAGYHCTIHPSMVGQIVPVPVVLPDGQTPVPPDGQTPVPPDAQTPTPYQPPPSYDDGSDDGYDYDYY
jgi:hypothetical protein